MRSILNQRQWSDFTMWSTNPAPAPPPRTQRFGEGMVSWGPALSKRGWRKFNSNFPWCYDGRPESWETVNLRDGASDELLAMGSAMGGVKETVVAVYLHSFICISWIDRQMAQRIKRRKSNSLYETNERRRVCQRASAFFDSLVSTIIFFFFLL